MKLFFISVMLLSCFAAKTQIQKTQECIIINGSMQLVDVDYNSQTGEKTVMYNGQRTNFDKFNSSQYAAGAKWYINNEDIMLSGQRYAKYGLPRVLSTTDVVKTLSYKGVGVYAEPTAPTPAEVIYIPVRPGCEFQPYQKLCYIKVVIKSNLKTVKAGQNIILTATATGAPGEKFTYNWSTDNGAITGQGKKTITISTKGMQPGILTVNAEVTGKKCTSFEYTTVEVK